MQKLKLPLLLLLMVTLISCRDENYPQYSLKTITYIPDSLKDKSQKYIIETVRAASQHMTGGDYEDVDETISQAEQTVNNIYSIKVVGLAKQLNESDWSPFEIKPCDFTPRGKQIFDSLSNVK